MTIDSNILIAYLSGETVVVETLSQWKVAGTSLFLPTVVEAEVLSFAKWSSAERTKIELFLEQEFISVPFDRSIARIAGRIRQGRAIKLPDAAIAATAFYTNSPLVTRNTRDFKNIPDLTVIEI